MYTMTTFVKTFTQFSILKRSFNNIIKQGRFIKHNVKNHSVIYNEYNYYYTTSICFSQKKKKAIIPKQTKRKLNVVGVWKNITVTELADILQRDVNDILSAAELVDNQTIYKKKTAFENLDIIHSVVRKLGFACKIVAHPNQISEPKNCDIVKRPPPDESVLIKRRPVVTIMGHVDHGKTTLLDALRNTSVVETEFGGITQHIGAFNVELSTGEKITFLDTPGHAAFSAMRERGAKATDIVVLVVAADDGVMEQTVQSINMAKQAEVPIIVAINKIDKYNSNIERTLKMLQEVGIYVEQLGGNVQSVNISALKGTNLNTLIEAITLEADMIGLKGDPTGLVEGVVIECRNDPNRGKMSTALIQRGTLKKGAILVSGTAWAKVRSMFDHAGRPVIQAGLSDAIQIMGWRELPNVGDEILEVESESIAHEVIKYRMKLLNNSKAEEHKAAADKKLQEHLVEYKEQLKKKRSLRLPYYPRLKKNETIDLIPAVNVVIKADVAGSAEAILDVIDTYNEDEKCRLNVVHYGIGPITESDVEIATVFNAIIYRFNVNIPSIIENKVKNSDISVRSYNVIYKLIDDIKSEIENKLPLKEREQIIGEATVLKLFDMKIDKKKVTIAGCLCTKGFIKKNQSIHLKRGEEVIYTGKLLSIRHLKEEIELAKSGVECGVRLDDSSISFEPNDILVCFQRIKEKENINWNTGF